MNATYAISDEVTYEGDLPYEDCDRNGTVAEIETDGVNGAQIVTVEFDCGHVQVIPGDELRTAE